MVRGCWRYKSSLDGTFALKENHSFFAYSNGWAFGAEAHGQTSQNVVCLLGAFDQYSMAKRTARALLATREKKKVHTRSRSTIIPGGGANAINIVDS